MDEIKQNLQGSWRNDVFRRKHKEISKYFYGIDIDSGIVDSEDSNEPNLFSEQFAIVNKCPPGIVAYYDIKAPKENVTFAEAIAYNEWIKSKPVYIIECENPEFGPFVIKEYLGADWHPEPPIVQWGEPIEIVDWLEFETWEAELRKNYRIQMLKGQY